MNIRVRNPVAKIGVILDAMRPWWRLTEKPTAGWVVAAWFALQSASMLLLGDIPAPVRAIAVVTYALVAVTFAASSLRLSRRPQLDAH